MILAFGILSLVGPCFIGIVFGPMAWFMGTADLAAIDAGEMSNAGRGLTQAGRVLGGVGFVLQALWLVGTILYFVFIFAMIGAG
jgi:hypothetical protein